MTHDLQYSTRKTVCPCGHGTDFVPLASHTDGGKCWANHCGQKYFPPTDNKRKARNFDTGRNATQYDRKPAQPAKDHPEEIYTFDRTHIYWQPDGENYLFRIVIHKALSGRKKVWQERWDGTLQVTGFGVQPNGEWRHGLADTPLTLYNAPLLPFWRYYYDTHPEETTRLLFIVEGEKDAETLWQRHFPATCNPQGAGKWKPEFSPLVQGFDVVLLPDYDEAGIKHAEDVAAKIAGYARTIRIVKLWEIMPELPPKGDVTDFVERGGEL